MSDIARIEARSLDTDVLRNQFAPSATDAELEHFALVCRHLSLDPYADQIVLIGRNQKIKVRDEHGREVERWVMIHKPQITVAGRRTIATRTGRLRGIVGPEWCGPRRVDRDGVKLPLEWEEVWTGDDPPYAARVLVWPADWIHPANGTVKWSEFAQYTDRDRKNLSPFWSRAPSHMLGKVAESLAFRRAFPEVDSAITTYEDRAGFDIDDGSILVEAEAGKESGSERSPVPSVHREPSRSDPDRVPDWVYDNEPEAINRSGEWR